MTKKTAKVPKKKNHLIRVSDLENSQKVIENET